MMEYLNLIPIAALALWVLKSIKDAAPRDQVDRYFQENKLKTGKNYRNIFGVPTRDL